MYCYRIYGKQKAEKRFKPFDYKGGKFVVNLIYATYWHRSCQSHVRNLVETMNKDNNDYIFEMRRCV